MASRGDRIRTGSPNTSISPSVDRVGAVDGPQHLGAPGTGEAGDAEDLAFADGQVDVVQQAPTGQAAHRQRHGAGRRRSGSIRSPATSRPTISSHQAVRRQVRRSLGR